jgi:nucleolin
MLSPIQPLFFCFQKKKNQKKPKKNKWVTPTNLISTIDVHKEPQREKPPGCRHIFMGNLADEVTEEDVMSLFQTCGPIVAVTWMNDRHSGRFKGCGFVEFADEASTSHAASLNGSEIRGRPMRVDYATIQETRNGERQKGYSGRNTSAAIHSRYRDNSPPRGGGPRSPPRSNYSSDSHSQQQQQQYQGQPQQHQPQQQTQQSATAGGLNAQQQQLLLLATLNPAALQQAGMVFILPDSFSPWFDTVTF